MIDTHFHCWRRADVNQAGILAAPYLQHDFSFADLEAAWEGLPVEGAVEVQVNDFTDGTVEARYVEAVAQRHPKLRAHVAWARLESPGVAAELDALQRIRLVRGVRRTCQIESAPDFCAHPDYVRGVRLLGERGLLCEICVRLEQVRSVPRLAREAPETQVVLQHMGKPDVTKAPPAYWMRAVEELGKLENVTCKLSVAVHSESDPPYDPDRLAPFVEHLVDCFGWDRLQFGSNWPVSTSVIGYRDWVETLREILGAHGGDHSRLERVFGENARLLYRL